MKQKKDPVLKDVLRRIEALGPMLNNVRHRFDKELDTYVFTIETLDLGDDGFLVTEFELSLDQMLWYTRGLMNGTTYLINLQAMGEEMDR